MNNEIAKMYTWPLDFVYGYLRYFLMAGSGYFVFYIWKRKKFSSLKIQKKIPEKRIVLNEIKYSALSLLIYGFAGYLVAYWYKQGFTKIYVNISDYGYAYFFVSIVVFVLIHDAYFYWTHRMMHLPALFKYVHKVHHVSSNPTPWTALSFHPLEAIISFGIIPLIIFLIPCHPFSLLTFLSYTSLVNIIGHLGYEIFPKRFVNSKIGRWHNTGTNHNIHHQFSKKNYGLYFVFWDKLMQTYSKDNGRNAERKSNEKVQTH